MSKDNVSKEEMLVRVYGGIRTMTIEEVMGIELSAYTEMMASKLAVICKCNLEEMYEDIMMHRNEWVVGDFRLDQTVISELYTLECLHQTVEGCPSPFYKVVYDLIRVMSCELKNQKPILRNFTLVTTQTQHKVNQLLQTLLPSEYRSLPECIQNIVGDKIAWENLKLECALAGTKLDKIVTTRQDLSNKEN